MLSQSALRVHSTTTTTTIIAHKSLPVDPLAAILAQVRAYLKQLDETPARWCLLAVTSCCPVSQVCGGSVAVVGAGASWWWWRREEAAGRPGRSLPSNLGRQEGGASCTDGYQALLLASTTGGSCCTRVWNVSCTPPPPSSPPPSPPPPSPPPSPPPPPSAAA